MTDLINLTGLGKAFRQKNGPAVTILRDINLTIGEGETLCVLGESGCGKTTLGKIIAGLSGYTSGSYKFMGKEVGSLQGQNWKEFRKSVQLIHQNPYESLNPALMIFDIIANPIKRNEGITKTADLYKRVTQLLELVGLTPVEDIVDKFPSLLSGGQRQRVSIARVLAMNPKVIVVDEATSMIDTSLRVSLLTTLRDIQDKLGVSYFFITHDLALGKYFSRGQKVMIMYLGGLWKKRSPMTWWGLLPIHIPGRSFPPQLAPPTFLSVPLLKDTPFKAPTFLPSRIFRMAARSTRAARR
jgi:ABC-type glutathione transport system ATPase component